MIYFILKSNYNQELNLKALKLYEVRNLGYERMKR